MPQLKTSKMNEKEVDTIRIKKRESTKKSKDRKRIKKKYPKTSNFLFMKLPWIRKRSHMTNRLTFLDFMTSS